MASLTLGADGIEREQVMREQVMSEQDLNSQTWIDECLEPLKLEAERLAELIEAQRQVIETLQAENEELRDKVEHLNECDDEYRIDTIIP